MRPGGPCGHDRSTLVKGGAVLAAELQTCARLLPEEPPRGRSCATRIASTRRSWPSLCVTSLWPGAEAVLTRGWHRSVLARTSAGRDLRAGTQRTPWIGGDFVSGYWWRGAALSPVPDGGAEGAALSLPHHRGLPAGLCSRGWGAVEAEDSADAGFRAAIRALTARLGIRIDEWLVDDAGPTELEKGEG